MQVKPGAWNLLQVSHGVQQSKILEPSFAVPQTLYISMEAGWTWSSQDLNQVLSHGMEVSEEATSQFYQMLYSLGLYYMHHTNFGDYLKSI